MARGATVTALLAMLKGELGVENTSGIAPGGDAVLTAALSSSQKWLATEYEWPFLQIRQNVSMSAGTRYYDFPTSDGAQVFNHERPILADCYDSGMWNTVEQGIGIEHYNASDPDAGERQDPVRRWQYYRGATLQFEVWPVPATDTMLRLTGQKTLPVLASASDTAELDDLLLVLWTAAELSTQYGDASAAAKLAKAQRHLGNLRKGYAAPSQVFNMNGSGCGRRRGDLVIFATS